MASTIIRQYIVERENEARLADQPHLKAELVARMHVDGSRSIDYVMDHYGLTRAQVHAALAYYYENQATLDAVYEQSWNESRGTRSDDLMAAIRARQERE